MGNFFNPEQGIWSWLSTLVDICGLSLVWVFLCLPIVTIGPATAALYFAVVKCVRRKEGGAFGCYFRSFRENLRTGIPATLICVAAVALLACGYAIMRLNRNTPQGYIMYAAYYVLLILPAGLLCYLFPMLGRFTFGVRELFITAFQLTVRHLPSTVVVVLLVAETAAFTINNWWPVLFMPAVAALLCSLFFERIFLKYSPELAAEAQEKAEETDAG